LAGLIEKSRESQGNIKEQPLQLNGQYSGWKTNSQQFAQIKATNGTSENQQFTENRQAFLLNRKSRERNNDRHLDQKCGEGLPRY
jgi:hypothetical protein